jgi:hypothetical protein
MFLGHDALNGVLVADNVVADACEDGLKRRPIVRGDTAGTSSAIRRSAIRCRVVSFSWTDVLRRTLPGAAAPPDQDEKQIVGVADDRDLRCGAAAAGRATVPPVRRRRLRGPGSITASVADLGCIASTRDPESRERCAGRRPQSMNSTFGVRNVHPATRYCASAQAEHLHDRSARLPNITFIVPARPAAEC